MSTFYWWVGLYVKNPLDIVRPLIFSLETYFDCMKMFHNYTLYLQKLNYKSKVTEFLVNKINKHENPEVSNPD